MTDKTKLPVVGSSASSTVFCSAKIEGPGGHLWIDGNAKITASNGTYKRPMPNAFSLEAQAVVDREGGGLPACPGSTSVCRSSCYVHGLEAAAKDTYALYRHNSTMIRQVLAESDTNGIAGRASEWAWNVARWITDNAPGGFRWHVSGDIYSRRYASWIAAVVRRSPKVDHWIYTRSFGPILEPLLDLANLALNLSCDRENYDAAFACMTSIDARKLSTPVQLCYLTDDGKVPAGLPDGSVIFPDYSLRGARDQSPKDQRDSSAWWQGLTEAQRKMVCPVDFYGKSEELRCGPCRKCML